jgi:hypothetical protein
MSFQHSGEGTALIVRPKCNKIKKFKSSLILKFTDDMNTRIIEYKNSLIGKRLLAGIIQTFPNMYASNDSLNFRFIYFSNSQNRSGWIIYITGVYKKCQYTSREVQYFDPSISATNTTILDLVSRLNSFSLKDEELNKLLKSDPELNRLYIKLNE